MKRKIFKIIGISFFIFLIYMINAKATNAYSFERELSYMVVHGFYHLMGYDHIKEEDKKEMRPKEEKILNDLKIIRK